MKGSGSPYRDGPGHEPDKVIYSLDKMENYLLNLNNIDGKSKAKFLKDVLGYASGDGEMLHNELLKSIKGQDASNVTVTEYGVKYEYDVKLGGKNGNSAKVIVVYQNDNGTETYRIITLYPGKKETK